MNYNLYRNSWQAKKLPAIKQELRRLESIKGLVNSAKDRIDILQSITNKSKGA
jgi:hypothetical protein